VSDATRPGELDWSQVGHAYGRATDTPGHLANLVAEDEKLRADALTHLWSAVLHQGTLYSATAPAAVVIANMLHDRRLDSPVSTQVEEALDVPPESLRAALLNFLAVVGESCTAFHVGAEVTERQLTDWATPNDPIVERAASAMEFDEFSDEWPDDVLERASQAYFARAILAFRRVAPQLLAAVVPFVSDPDLDIRLSAANAVKKLTQWANNTHG
jgi:hypothetical protein